MAKKTGAARQIFWRAFLFGKEVVENEQKLKNFRYFNLKTEF